MVYYRRRTGRSRARRGSSRRSVNRRSNLWIRTPELRTTQLAALETWAFDLTSETYLDPGALIGSTVVRVRASIEVAFGPNSVGGNTQAIFALAVAPKDVLQPIPGVKPYENRNDWDWMAWEPFSPVGVNQTGFVTAIPAPTGVVTNHVVDVKSSRRLITPNDTLVGFLQFHPGSATEPGNITVAAVWSSVLLKLS